MQFQDLIVCCDRRRYHHRSAAVWRFVQQPCWSVVTECFCLILYILGIFAGKFTIFTISQAQYDGN